MKCRLYDSSTCEETKSYFVMLSNSHYFRPQFSTKSSRSCSTTTARKSLSAKTVKRVLSFVMHQQPGWTVTRHWVFLFMCIYYTDNVRLTMVTTKVNIHTSAIKTDNLTIRIKFAHFLSWLKGKMGMHDWHSTGHGLKHFLSFSGDQKLHEIVEKQLHLKTTHRDLSVVKCTLWGTSLITMSSKHPEHLPSGWL